MLIVDFFRRESTTSLRRIVIMALVSGLANGLILALVNTSAEHAWNKVVHIRNLFLYGIVLVLFIYSKKYAMAEANRVVEEVLSRVRLRIADKLRKADLAFIERLGQSTTYSTLTQDTNLISQTAMVMIAASASVVMVAACLLYIAYVSIAAFVMTAAAVSIGVSLYLSHREETFRNINESNREEAAFFDLLNHVLQGFQALKMNRRRSASIFGDLTERSAATRELKVEAGQTMTVDYMFSQVFYYILIAVVLFLLPTLMPSQTPNAMKLTAAILFLMGSLDFVVGSIPLFTRSTVAVQNLQRLEAELDEAGRIREHEEGAEIIPIDSFDEVKAESLEFSYRSAAGEPLFTVGPIDLEIRRGEVLFIVGGNGSGKSTLLRLLTGLYYPDSGALLVDKTRIGPTSYNSYRELFSFVPADFHLFDRLYGLEDTTEERVNEMLKLMDLHRKTTFKDGRFTTQDLSTGQRKRLALIVALLENRSIYVLDECAADQDPGFKRYFYETLLPVLKEDGKTVVAATHDDHYFHVADRVIELEFGSIASQRTQAHG